MNVKHLNQAAVLAALYNNSRQQGMGFNHTRGQAPMSVAQAEMLLKQKGAFDFDYLHGRVLKVWVSPDGELDPRLYDRDNGQGAAERALAPLFAAQAAA
jgi:hypothetical protein